MLRKRDVPVTAAVVAALSLFACLPWMVPANLTAQQPAAPPSTLLVAIDQRPALSLNGDWPYKAYKENGVGHAE